MCGIFGAIITSESSAHKDAVSIAHDLFLESERRGKEASGVVFLDHNQIGYLKIPKPVEKLWSSAEGLLGESVNEDESFVFIGHTRLVTNGALDDNLNNQPVKVGRTIGIHNGIIVNDKAIWGRHPELVCSSDVDSEALIALVDSLHMQSGVGVAVSDAYKEVEGTASTAFLFDDCDEMVIATNNGSLYVYHVENNGVFLFASEFRILRAVVDKYFAGQSLHIKNLPANHVASIDMRNPTYQPSAFAEQKNKTTVSLVRRSFNDYSVYPPVQPPDFFVHEDTEQKILALYEQTKLIVNKLRRCARCILPETFPGISFDEHGVCDLCNAYSKKVLEPGGGEALKERIKATPRSDVARLVNADMVMGFSGGRDSCFGLHYLVKELGLRPIVYTYDWGVITDLGRRNQSRLCAKLGIEHVLVSADIAKKRANVRKNILAWMKDPDLGMVPLFMAGDKQYFRHLNSLAKDLSIHNILLCENYLERSLFKNRFGGMSYADLGKTTYLTTHKQKAQILAYYGKKFITNPAYWNESLFDSLSGFASYFGDSNKIPYHQLFDFVAWDETHIDETLKSEYDWEFAEDTKTSWRIGDGTAPWYNFIYYIGAGFSEQETFRSNQVREGQITRAEALSLAERDNYPRFPSLKWYFETMQVDLGQAVSALRLLPRRYTKQ